MGSKCLFTNGVILNKNTLLKLVLDFLDHFRIQGINLKQCFQNPYETVAEGGREEMENKYHFLREIEAHNSQYRTNCNKSGINVKKKVIYNTIMISPS
jgi:protein-arginine kinase